MLLYGITLTPLARELRAAESGILSSFYVDDVAFDGSAIRSAHLLKLFIERGVDRGYLTFLAKSLSISDNLGQEETARQEFAADDLVLNFVSGSRYLGPYLVPQEELAV